MPLIVLMGETPDISHLCDYGWYMWLKFWDPEAKYPKDKKVLGRYLGPSENFSLMMTARVLIKNGQVLHTSTHHPLNDKEIKDVEEKKLRDDFDECILEKIREGVDEESLKEIHSNIVIPEDEQEKREERGSKF